MTFNNLFEYDLNSFINMSLLLVLPSSNLVHHLLGQKMTMVRHSKDRAAIIAVHYLLFTFNQYSSSEVHDLIPVCFSILPLFSTSLKII